jgi:hypothetical protein
VINKQKEYQQMSSQDLSKLNDCVHLLRDTKKIDTEEGFQLAIQRFNELSALLQNVIQKELQTAV